MRRLGRGCYRSRRLGGAGNACGKHEHADRQETHFFRQGHAFNVSTKQGKREPAKVGYTDTTFWVEAAASRELLFLLDQWSPKDGVNMNIFYLQPGGNRADSDYLYA